MEKECVIYPLNLPNMPMRVGWFDDVKSFLSRGFGPIRRVKACMAGKLSFMLTYGERRSMINNVDYSVNYFVVEFDWLFVPKLLRDGKIVNVSKENMAYLLGFATVCVDKDGKVEMEHGKPKVIFNTEAMYNWLRVNYKTYKAYTFMTFVTEEDTEIMLAYGFKS